MNAKINNTEYNIKDYDYASKKERGYRAFIKRVKVDNGELVNTNIGYQYYLNESLVDAIPVARNVGVLYKPNGDDYSVVANGNRYEFAREGFYRKVAANVPRFDWSNGKQELLDEGNATSSCLFFDPNSTENRDFNVAYSLFNWGLGLGMINSTHLDVSSATVAFRYFGTSIIGIDNCISCYVKMDDNSEPRVSADSSDINTDLTLSIANSASGTFGKYRIPNTDIWRVWFSGKGSNRADFNGVVKYQGQSSKSFICSGFQLEEGTQPSSPIITNGSIVTRPADIITNSQGQLAPGRYDSI